MFSAKGLAIKRSNGEVVTPFYFAYEDLREDWSKLVEQADAMDGVEEGAKGKMTKKLAVKPKVNRHFLLFHTRNFDPHAIPYYNFGPHAISPSLPLNLYFFLMLTALCISTQG